VTRVGTAALDPRPSLAPASHPAPACCTPTEEPDMPESPLRWWHWALIAVSVAAIFTAIAWTAPTC
jgi:hypothetical protein